jgi:hypothetical protein
MREEEEEEEEEEAGKQRVCPRGSSPRKPIKRTVKERGKAKDDVGEPSAFDNLEASRMLYELSSECKRVWKGISDFSC